MKKILFPILIFFAVFCKNVKAQIPPNDPTKKADAYHSSSHHYYGFPYHPVAYFLDLSIFCYQLYGQTLVWPFDPYYERVKKRNPFMDTIRKWVKSKGNEQSVTSSSANDFRGPGDFGHFANNERHDPIIYRYSTINPRNNCIVNADGKWTIYKTPREITNQVREVYMCYRKKEGSEKDITVEKILFKNEQVPETNASNILVCFEGGTGDKGNAGQPASQSLMGFVLLRRKNNNRYDIDIAFRGSRSGSGARAFIQAFPGENPKGNPDWIIDFGYDFKDSAAGAGNITTKGEVNRGMMYSMNSMLPAVFKCLFFVDSLANHESPENIYVTGHSLGGALAQHFVSAVLMGNSYNVNRISDSNQNKLISWPWKQIKLLTFSSPRAGNKLWAETLTEQHLSSEFFDTRLSPYDRQALRVTDTSIVNNLLNDSKPCAYRALIPTDPITSGKIGHHGKPVGKTLYVKPHRWTDIFRFFDLPAHEPMNVRGSILCRLDKCSIPEKAWEYQSLRKMNPKRIKYKRGSVKDIDNLVSEIKNYYKQNSFSFDENNFDADLKLWKKLMGY